jgi:predicted O-methyltransferase YrrM
MNKIRQIVAYLRHFLTAWNTTGEAIHSPYLFRLVRFDMRDRNPFYCFANIERQRDLLLVCDDTLDVVDYGSAGSPKGLHVQRRVCDIAKNHLESPKMAQLLFRILHFMHEEEKRPLEILELGTSFGITTAYLASADSRDRVTTLEGSGAVLRIAQGIWRNLKLENIEWYEGNVDDTLYNIYEEKSLIANRKSLIDFAYIDANHTYEATLRYTDYLLPRMTEKGIIAIDDIHYSQDMERAWKKLQQDPRVTTSMDLYHMGLLFVDKHYLKRHYRIRI